MKLDEHDSKYKLFIDRATEALVTLDAATTPVKASQILEWVENNYPDDLKLLSPSWGSHLSTATSDATTRIRREPGRYTYTLLGEAPAQQSAKGDAGGDAETQADVCAAEAEPEADERSTYTKREAALYPVLRDWLVARKYRARDTSRSKGGGTWGNPDVAGIKVTEGYFGRHDIELATIEAKVSNAGWRQQIFEAVSHKRFAHRAYFAFAFGSDDPGLDRIPYAADLRAYAERYRLGILVIFMPKEAFERLHEEKADQVKLDSADLRVEELWPALYEDVRADETVQYLYRVLDIDSDEALFGFERE